MAAEPNRGIRTVISDVVMQALTKTLKISLGALRQSLIDDFAHHDKIIAHVFTVILHRTWKHNRPGVLWKDRHINIDLCLQLQNMENIPCSSPKQAIYFAVWYKKHDPKIVY